MSSINIEMLQTVAKGLEELKEKVVFVGGAIAELYADDPASSDIRPTQDIDFTTELRSYKELSEFEEDLRKKRFANDTSAGAPICRWIYQNIKVDVMPADENILGFKNKWYLVGVENKILKTLPDGTDIYVFTPEYYLASKFDAYNDRGGNDLRQSHDFEDIIYVLDNCIDILENIKSANENVKWYLKSECKKLLNNEDLSEAIYCALPFGSDSDRVEMIKAMITAISEFD